MHLVDIKSTKRLLLATKLFLYDLPERNPAISKRKIHALQSPNLLSVHSNISFFNYKLCKWTFVKKDSGPIDTEIRRLNELLSSIGRYGLL